MLRVHGKLPIVMFIVLVYGGTRRGARVPDSRFNHGALRDRRGGVPFPLVTCI